MGFSAGVGFLVDTDGNGTNDGKVVTLKKGSNITLSLTGSTLTISSTGGSGAVRTVTVDGSTLGSSESLDLVSGEGIDLSESDGDVTIAGENATTTNKGIASFSSDNFDVTSGAVTIKAGGVDLTAEVTGTLPVANGGTGATSLNNLITLGTHTTGNYVATIADSGGGTITVANSGSESAGVTLAVDTSVIASKTYVDSVAQGLSVSDAVAVATTANITLSGEQTIDGVTTSTSRVLVKNQTDGKENGIYVSASGAWARASDMNSDNPNEFPGTFVFVSGGTTNADLGFVCTVDTDFDLGTDDVTFSQFSSAGHITAGSGLDKSGNTMSVDVSDFMATGVDHRVLTATGTDAFEGEANLTFDGSTLDIKGGLSLGAAGELTITESSDDITIKNTVSDKDIIFKVNDGGSDTEVMRIDGALSSIRIGQSTSNAADGPDAKLDVRGANDNSVSIMASGALSVENSVEVTAPSSRAYAFLSVDNGNAMVGGNLRLDDSVSGGSHDGYASGTDARGGAGIILTNTSSNDDGQIQFVRQNDSNDDSWTVKESMRIDASGYLGINDTNPISELSVAGMISITAEQGSTPSAPADGHGFLYTKSDGKLYWRSADLGETDLTVGDTDTNTFRTVTAGGNTLGATETLAFAAGSNITISENNGTVTIASTASGAVSEAFKTISVAGQSDVVADSATDTLTFAAGSNIAIATDAGGDQITISATGTISGGITVQEEGSALSTLGDTLNFVGSAVTASGTGTTKTITISGGGAFARNGNIIETTETIGVGGTNVEELSLIDASSLTNSEAIMTASGTDATSVKTFGMGMRKNITIVAADADTGEDTYTVADTDHIIMICNVNPNNAKVNSSQILKTVQLPVIGSEYIGRELTITLHGLSGTIFDIINVKPGNDDSILYHGKMWDNNQTDGDHLSGLGGMQGGLGLTMGHVVITDVNWAALNQASVVSVTMVALDASVLVGLLAANPDVSYSSDPTLWLTDGDSMTAGIWLVTQVSGVNGQLSGVLALGSQLASVDGGELYASGGKGK
mgnify:CR=1 FL=1